MEPSVNKIRISDSVVFVSRKEKQKEECKDSVGLSLTDAMNWKRKGHSYGNY